MQQAITVTRRPDRQLAIRWLEGVLSPPVSIYWSDRPDGADDFEFLAVAKSGNEIAVPDPSPDRRPYFLLVPAGGKPTIAAERRLPLDGEVNFRDLGGYAAGDGRTVKWGQLYRSGELGRLSAADLAYLAGLDIKLVCDLRDDFEVKQLPDRLPAGAERLELPIRGGDMPMEVVHAAFDNGDFSRVDTKHLINSNRLFVRKFTPTYAEMLRRVTATGGRPALIHCTVGKDRSGLGAAIFLWILGVPMETVFDDYLLSNMYRARINEETFAMIRQVATERTGFPAGAVDLAPLEALLEARRGYLQTAVDTIVEDYGSIDNYIRDGLGMRSAARRAFQEAMLE